MRLRAGNHWTSRGPSPYATQGCPTVSLGCEGSRARSAGPDFTRLPSCFCGERFPWRFSPGRREGAAILQSPRMCQSIPEGCFPCAYLDVQPRISSLRVAWRQPDEPGWESTVVEENSADRSFHAAMLGEGRWCKPHSDRTDFLGEKNPKDPCQHWRSPAAGLHTGLSPAARGSDLRNSREN